MRAGILEEDGKITHPVTGTPQGAIISPVLANIYLHYVLDIWFKQVIKNKSVSKDCRFTPLDSNDLIGRRLWPIIKEMIKTVIENKQNVIIEGSYLLPHLVKDLEKDYSEKIISVFLGFSAKYIK